MGELVVYYYYYEGGAQLLEIVGELDELNALLKFERS